MCRKDPRGVFWLSAGQCDKLFPKTSGSLILPVTRRQVSWALQSVQNVLGVWSMCWSQGCWSRDTGARHAGARNAGAKGAGARGAGTKAAGARDC